jgi:hypothetical protein
VFDASLARHLGLDLKAGYRDSATGIGGSTEVWVHEVCLYLPGGPPVTTHAAFKEGLQFSGLLGMNGFFEHFKVTFNPLGLCCEIDRVLLDQE